MISIQKRDATRSVASLFLLKDKSDRNAIAPVCD